MLESVVETIRVGAGSAVHMKKHMATIVTVACAGAGLFPSALSQVSQRAAGPRGSPKNERRASRESRVRALRAATVLSLSKMAAERKRPIPAETHDLSVRSFPTFSS